MMSGPRWRKWRRAWRSACPDLPSILWSTPMTTAVSVRCVACGRRIQWQARNQDWPNCQDASEWTPERRAAQEAASQAAHPDEGTRSWNEAVVWEAAKRAAARGE